MVRASSKICTSHSSHLSLLMHQTQTQACSKEMLEECECAKLARRNAESMSDLWLSLPHTAMQTALLFCCHNKLTDWEALGNTKKFQTKAMERVLLKEIYNTYNKDSSHHIFNYTTRPRNYGKIILWVTLTCHLHINNFVSSLVAFKFYESIIFNGRIQCFSKKCTDLLSRNF